MAKRTKADIVEAVGMPMKTVNALLEYIVAEVAAGNAVQLTGFGTFKSTLSPEREVRVPSTGETMRAEPKFRPKFAAGAGFKDEVAKRKP